MPGKNQIALSPLPERHFTPGAPYNRSLTSTLATAESCISVKPGGCIRSCLGHQTTRLVGSFMFPRMFGLGGNKRTGRMGE